MSERSAQFTAIANGTQLYIDCKQKSVMLFKKLANFNQLTEVKVHSKFEWTSNFKL